MMGGKFSKTTGRPGFRKQLQSAAKRGTSQPKRDYRREDDESLYPSNWPELSLAVRRRDGWRCQGHKLQLIRKPCDVFLPPPFHGRLHAHHIVPLPKGSNDMSNLITLCPDCHGLAHGRSMGKGPSIRQKFYASKS